MSRADLAAAAADPQLPGIDALIVGILNKGADEGLPANGEWFLNRLLGKVTDKVEHSMPKPFVVKRADGSALELGAAPTKEED